MRKYTVDSPVRYNNKDYQIGEEIELSDKDAKQPLELGAVSSISAAPVTKLTKTEEEERRQQEEKRLQAESDAKQMTDQQREALNVQIEKLLEGAVDKIVEVITGRDKLGVVTFLDAHLAALLSAEQNGKARKTLIAAIEEEQLRRMEDAQGQP